MPGRTPPFRNRTIIGLFLAATTIGVTAHLWINPRYGVVPDDLLSLDVRKNAPADLRDELQGSKIEHSGLSARFRTDSAGTFRYMEFGWDDSGLDAPCSIEIRNGRSTPLPPEVTTRLSALLDGGITSDGSWSRDGVRIEARDNKLSLFVDSKKHRELFVRRVVAGFRVLDSAAFGAPLNVDPAEMHAVFGQP
jgi:hypothetical protein